MDTATIERAFDPFFTTKTRGRGTGLGLATLHGMVTNAGGRATIASAPGQGTTVTLTFPLSERAAEVAAPQVVNAVSGPPETPGVVLVVEDDDATRQVAGRMLDSLGYDVLLAPGGDRAIELAQTHRNAISIVLTDVMMPGMRGPDVAVRLGEFLPDVPVLFMSGYAGDALRDVPGLRLDTDFLAKPFTAGELSRLIANKLAERPLNFS